MTPTWKIYGDSLPSDRWCEECGAMVRAGHPEHPTVFCLVDYDETSQLWFCGPVVEKNEQRWWKVPEAAGHGRTAAINAFMENCELLLSVRPKISIVTREACECIQVDVDQANPRGCRIHGGARS